MLVLDGWPLSGVVVAAVLFGIGACYAGFVYGQISGLRQARGALRTAQEHNQDNPLFI